MKVSLGLIEKRITAALATEKDPEKREMLSVHKRRFSMLLRLREWKDARKPAKA